MQLTAHLTGMAAMISSVRMALTSTGAMHKDRLQPSTYATSAVNSSDTRTLRMALKAGSVKAVDGQMVRLGPDCQSECQPIRL